MIKQVLTGTLDIVTPSNAPLTNFVPELKIFDMPFLFRDEAHMIKVLRGPVLQDISNIVAKRGIRLLGVFNIGVRHIMSKKPVKSIADLKGLKIRVQQSDLWVGMIQSLGANATPMPYGEVYTALKTGLVDAAENNWPSYESSRHFEAAKFYNITEHSLAPEVLVMSKKVWDILSKEDQAAVRKAAKDSVPVMRKLWDDREQASRKTVEAAGVQVITIANKAEFVDAMKPVYEKFANNEKLKSLVKRIQDTK